MIDDVTKKNIADSLWLDSYDETKLPKSIKEAINSPKNSNSAFGERTRSYLTWLKGHPQDHNPNYKKRYQSIIDNTQDISPQQAYIISTSLLGNNSTQGYDQMPEVASFKFPHDHAPKFKTKVGWHFFVGSAWDEDGQEYGIELMFFRVALMPPGIAAEQGLTDIENQVVEMQLGISKAGERHHQADPMIIAGTTGLIGYRPSPFTYALGKNNIQSQEKGKFLPITIQAQGIDRGGKKNFKLGVDITFTEGKEYLLQGGDGCAPCIAGMGTLYYSIPNLIMKPGSTINYGGKTIKLKKGTFWFDHQWGSLGGNADSKVLRAASNISKPGPSGWDWYMAQFDGDRQITMCALHSNKYLAYYFQTGSTPPPTMTIPVAAKYFDEHKNMVSCNGTLMIDKWVKSEQSPNPELYKVSHAWHPDHWKFEFDEHVPEDIRQFSMEQIVPVAQTNFFANAAQYNEGAVILKDKDGKDIGRGFAEAVQYSDPKPNAYRILGYTDKPELQKVLAKKDASAFGKVGSLMYMLTHQKDLKEVISRAKGMELLGGGTVSKKSHKHTSRY